MTHQTDRTPLTRAAVEDLFTARFDRAHAPATVFAVFDRQGVIYAGGYGDRGDGRAPTTDTAFRIASCSKSFTAAALLIMVERGLVELDAPVDTYLALGALTGPDGGVVAPPTLRQLVGMSGGLPTDDPWADRLESLPAGQFRALVSDGIRFVRTPGSGYEYSNLGFALLGAVIEEVSGRSFVDAVTTELIEPLGLIGVGYDQGLDGTDVVATGYARLDDAWVAQPVTGPGAFSSIGGVFATPRGLAQWAGWLSAAAIEGIDPNHPLGRDSRLLMQTAQTPIVSGDLDPQAYGMGLVIEDNHRHGTIVSHKGGYPGFGSYMRWHLDSGIGVLALENGRYAEPYPTTDRALELILDTTMRPESEPVLWPEVVAARGAVERLLRNWDPALAAGVLADNVDLDESLSHRARTIAALVDKVEPAPEPLPLLDSAPFSQTPAHLAWTVPGRHGSLRCEISLTPTEPPKIQTLVIRPG